MILNQNIWHPCLVNTNPSAPLPTSEPHPYLFLSAELDMLDAWMFQTTLKWICVKLWKGLEKLLHYQ